MKTMKISDIIIKDSFAATPPKKEKLDSCKEKYLETKVQDRAIVINHKNELIDGYCMYLTLKELGVDEAEIEFSEKCIKRFDRKTKRKQHIENKKVELATYIFGIHENSTTGKEYVWKVSKRKVEHLYKNVLPGDRVLVDTKYGKSPVIVTRIEEHEKCPVKGTIRRYICSLDRTNNKEVK